MTTATDMLAKYLAAEAEVLGGKTIQFNGRTYTSENLADIRKGRQEWERRVQAEAGKCAPTIGGLPYSVARFDGRD